MDLGKGGEAQDEAQDEAQEKEARELEVQETEKVQDDEFDDGLP